MKFLTAQEISRWIVNVGQTGDPHYQVESPVHHLQFYAPSKYSVIEAFVRMFVSDIISQGQILVQVIESDPFEDSKKFVIGRLWNSNSNGANCNLENHPGCLVDWEEREVAIALFSIMTCFSWQCYIYGEHDQIILLNWEGEIFDTWTSSTSKSAEFQTLLRRFGFKIVRKPPGAIGSNIDL